MTDIVELFARDPLTLTNDDITSIIEAMRQSRHQFVAGDKKAGTTKPRAAKVDPALAGLNLDIKL